METRSTQQHKEQLRREMRRIANLTHKVEEEKNLLHQIISLPAWQKAQTVLMYYPLFQEPDLLTLLERSKKSSHRFFFPRMHGDDLVLYEWFSEASWITGPHSVQEPDPETWRLVSLSEVDLALIPGLAFDSQGNRLGRGAGYFDRLLGNPTCRAIKVGIAWSWQLVPKIPCEDHDVKMDVVVTSESCFAAKLET